MVVSAALAWQQFGLPCYLTKPAILQPLQLPEDWKDVVRSFGQVCESDPFKTMAGHPCILIRDVNVGISFQIATCALHACIIELIT
jgi:hypothetical protein